MDYEKQTRSLDCVVDESLFESDCQRCGQPVEGTDGDPLDIRGVFLPVKCSRCNWTGYSRFNEDTQAQIEENFQDSSYPTN